MKLLVCGTRTTKCPNAYLQLVCTALRQFWEYKVEEGMSFEIIEGCCPSSADEYAEIWANKHNIKLNHFPSTTGNYLKRNIEMVEIADEVLAFWDGWSYGTAHTIANAVMKGIPVQVVKINGK
jgi:hypothetical protein